MSQNTLPVSFQRWQAQMHLQALELSFQSTSSLLESHRAICDAWHNGILQQRNEATWHALLKALDFDDLLCDELEARGVDPATGKRQRGAGTIEI
jgi:hypothetical protein